MELHPSGLENIGNTCYLNTAIQCLLSIPDISMHFYNLDNMGEWGGREVLVKNKVKRIGYEFSRLCKGLLEEKCVVRPEAFVKAFKVLHPNFNVFNQQDSHEIFLFILHNLHEATMDPVKMELSGEPKDKENALLLMAIKDKLKFLWDKKMNSYKISKLTNLLFFQEHTMIQCPECDELDNQFPMTCGIEVELNADNLNDCLDNYFKRAELKLDENNKWHCENCDFKGCPIKQNLIWNAPKYITFHLKRFIDRHQKNNSLIDFPLNDLDLTKYVSFGTIERDGFTSQIHKYNCIAVANHTGGLNGGHYYSCVKRNDKWYEINDAFTRPILDETKIISNHVSYLIYQRNDSL